MRAMQSNDLISNVNRNRFKGLTVSVICLLMVICSDVFAVDAMSDGQTSTAPPSDELTDTKTTGLAGFAWPALADVNMGGYLKNELAYRLHEPRSVTKIRNIFSFNADVALSERSHFKLSAWYYFDLAYTLFDYETISARFVRDEDQPLVFVENLDQKKDSNIAELREFYVDFAGDDYDLRLGKQFINWGVLEGARVVDEINPLNFRELITPNLLDYRISLWSARLDYYLDESDLELVVIPDIRFHKSAPQGSEWELLQEVDNTRFPESWQLRNTEWGLRWRKAFAGSEISLSYFYTWDDFPVIFRNAEINVVTEPTFFPTYTRIAMYGATFTRQMGGGILKGEFAYVPNKYFGLRSDVDNDQDGYLDEEGELQKKHIRWGLGFDFSRWGMDISPAIIQWIILDYEEGLIQAENDVSLTLFVRKVMRERSAVFQLLAIALVNLNELYVKPKMTFDISDRFQFAVGVDLFYGLKSQFGQASVGGGVINLNAVEQRAQFFGNFHDNDRAFVEFKCAF